jgi:hypothetical protein
VVCAHVPIDSGNKQRTAITTARVSNGASANDGLPAGNVFLSIVQHVHLFPPHFFFSFYDDGKSWYFFSFCFSLKDNFWQTCWSRWI